MGVYANKKTKEFKKRFENKFNWKFVRKRKITIDTFGQFLKQLTLYIWVIIPFLRTGKKENDNFFTDRIQLKTILKLTDCIDK